MDYPAVVLRIHQVLYRSTKVRTLLSYVSFATSNPKSEDSTIVLLLNFGSILQQNFGPTERVKNMLRWIF